MCVVNVHSVPVECDSCGLVWEAPLGHALSLNPGDTVTFAVGSVTALCPQCGASLQNHHMASGAVGSDGLRTPVMTLLTVARRLASRDTSELLALRAELERVTAERDDAAAERLLDGQGLHGWSRDSRLEPWAILTLLATVVIPLLPEWRASDAPAADVPTPSVVVNVNVVVPEPLGQDRVGTRAPDDPAHQVGPPH